MLYDPKWEEKIEVETLEPWRQLLLDAAGILEQKGWCQRVSVTAAGQYCITGAMGSITNLKSGTSIFTTAYDKLQDHLGVPPEYWNDAPNRTKEEVIAKVREVAQKA